VGLFLRICRSSKRAWFILLQSLHVAVLKAISLVTTLPQPFLHGTKYLSTDCSALDRKLDKPTKYPVGRSFLGGGDFWFERRCRLVQQRMGVLINLCFPGCSFWEFLLWLIPEAAACAPNAFEGVGKRSLKAITKNNSSP
jgi:hypothetical protein